MNRMHSSYRASMVLAGLIAAAGLVPARAYAEASTVDCPTASEQGQRLRDEGRYLRAREMFRECSRDSCPAVVRKECTKSLATIEDSMPTLVVSARDADGRDVGQGRLIVDGEVVMSKLEGKPLTVDPGEHTVRFEAEGTVPVELKIIVQVGEKNRLVRLKVEPSKSATGPATGPAATPTARQNDTEPAHPSAGADKGSSRPTPILAFVAAGVGVIAIGGFAFFGATGKSDLDNLKATCAPFCAQGDLDSAKTKLTVADVSLGVGVVAIGVAAVLFVTGWTAPAKAARLDVRPTSGGGVIGLSQAF